MKYPVYLDNNATTPVDPRVLEAMLPSLKDHFGNPASSSHEYGWYAEELVQIAREQVGLCIDAPYEEIVFTSGATESINLALQGVIQEARRRSHSRRPQVISAPTEHKATLDTLEFFASRGEIELHLLKVSPTGEITRQDFETAIRPNTVLVSLMLGNNEVGTIHRIEEFSKFTQAKDILFHCDATQAVGKLPLSVKDLGVDLLSFSAHKIYGPKGVGALYVKEESCRGRLTPLMHGGGHERGYRSGTLAVPGIVGFGKAAQIAKVERESDARKLRELSEAFFKSLSANNSALLLNGPEISNRLPGNLNISFPGKQASHLLSALRGKVACSASAACSSASGKASHVLSALSLPQERINSSLRIGIGRFNTEDQIAQAAAAFEVALR